MPQQFLEVDREKTAVYGITIDQVRQELYNAFGTRQVATIYTPSNDYQVILELEPRFQADPHMQRNAASSLEEWTHNTVGRRDLILRAQARYLAGGKKRTLSPDCYRMFFDYFGRG